MKGTLSRKKKSFWKPIVAGFLTMYLVTMGLVTLLVKEKFEDDYIKMFDQVATSIYRKAAYQEEKFENDSQKKEYYQCMVNEYFWSEMNPQLNISVAVYDEEQKLLAKSYDAIGDTMYSEDTSQVRYGPYVLDDYLTFEQKEELAEYYWREKESRTAADDTLPRKYGILIQTSPDGEELYNIYVQEMTWEEGQEENEKQGGEVVWEWTNSQISEEKKKNGELRAPDVIFPYMTSYERWHRWTSSKFLHDFPQEGSFSWDRQIEYWDLFRWSMGVQSRTSTEGRGYSRAIRLHINPDGGENLG